MKNILFLSFILFSSCASYREQNNPSAAPIVLGQVDPKLSSVKLFSNDQEDSDDLHFYVELRSAPKTLVDVNPKDIVIKKSKTILTADVQRLSIGKYKVTVKNEEQNLKSLKFSVKKKYLKHQLVTLKKPTRKNSSFKLVSNLDGRLKLRLTLKDKHGSMVELQHLPEIILEGLCEVSQIKIVKPGVWDVEIVYPEENQILYLSVRASGVQIERFFRYQHIEK
jgi:hypothetical protein